MSRLACLLALCATLSACATFSESSGNDPGAQDKEDLQEACRWVRFAEDLTELEACRPQRPFSLTQAEVEGLEHLPAPFRECVLEGMPSLRVKGDESAECQHGIARVVHERLRLLGWADNDVQPAHACGAQTPPQPCLTVRLSQRYQIGRRIFVSTDPMPKVSPKEVIMEAQRAIPANRWATQANMEVIRKRVARMKHVKSAEVLMGAGDPSAPEKGVAVVINVREDRP